MTSGYRIPISGCECWLNAGAGTSLTGYWLSTSWFAAWNRHRMT